MPSSRLNLPLARSRWSCNCRAMASHFAAAERLRTLVANAGKGRERRSGWGLRKGRKADSRCRATKRVGSSLSTRCSKQHSRSRNRAKDHPCCDIHLGGSRSSGGCLLPAIWPDGASWLRRKFLTDHAYCRPMLCSCRGIDLRLHLGLQAVSNHVLQHAIAAKTAGNPVPKLSQPLYVQVVYDRRNQGAQRLAPGV